MIFIFFVKLRGMKIKKDHLLIIVLVVLVILGLGIWVFLNNSQPSINMTMDDQNSLCEEASSHYVGLSELQAVDKAKRENRLYLVVERDGEVLTAVELYAPSRLNFEINKGVIQKATCG